MPSNILSDLQLLIALAAMVLSVVALLWHVYTWRTEQRHRVVIFQRHEDFVNRVEQWPGKPTQFAFYVSIINNSLRTPIVILGYDLEFPWKDDQFDWLPDPAESKPPTGTYQFAGGVTSYPREGVLNHLVHGQGRLVPGEVIDGALLGRGYADIPDTYKHGQVIRMRFSVIDQDHKRHSKKLLFKVFKPGSHEFLGEFADQGCG